MAVMLRVGGKNFNVDTYLQEHPCETVKVWRKGEACFPKSQPEGAKNEDSGLSITVGDAESNDLIGEIEDSILFLEDEVNRSEIQTLMSYPGIEGGTLDFGIDLEDLSEYPLQSFAFPPNLLRLAGTLGLCLEVSLNPFCGRR